MWCLYCSAGTVLRVFDWHVLEQLTGTRSQTEVSQGRLDTGMNQCLRTPLLSICETSPSNPRFHFSATDRIIDVKIYLSSARSMSYTRCPGKHARRLGYGLIRFLHWLGKKGVCNKLLGGHAARALQWINAQAGEEERSVCLRAQAALLRGSLEPRVTREGSSSCWFCQCRTESLGQLVLAPSVLLPTHQRMYVRHRASKQCFNQKFTFAQPFPYAG